MPSIPADFVTQVSLAAGKGELREVQETAEKLKMRINPWFAWYWYPDDKDFPDRNCLPDLTREGEYGRAEAVRLAAHAINPDFVLQFYGTPILPEPDAARIIKPDYQWRGWFGYGLAQGFGTKRLPCLYKPLDASDVRTGRWNMSRRMVRSAGQWQFVEAGKTLQQELDELGLHVVHIPGVVICNEALVAEYGRGDQIDASTGAWLLVQRRLDVAGVLEESQTPPPRLVDRQR